MHEPDTGGEMPLHTGTAETILPGPYMLPQSITHTDVDCILEMSMHILAMKKIVWNSSSQALVAVSEENSENLPLNKTPASGAVSAVSHKPSLPSHTLAPRSTLID